MEKTAVVEGEASESEAEDLDMETQNKDTENKFAYGIAVDGEAPESDDDNISNSKLSMSEAAEAITLDAKRVRKVSVNESILQKKLTESNASLWKNLNNFIQNTSLSASKQLLAADQLLMKTQVTLQSASYSWRTANTATKEISNKINDIVTANFIPSINI